MRIVCSLAFAVFALLGPAFAGDTTYSRTEPVPKSCPRPAPGQGPETSRDVASGSRERVSASPESSRAAGDESDFMSQCMQGDTEAHSLGDVFVGILAIPLHAGVCGLAYGIWHSHAHLFTGSGSMDDWDEGRWRLGWGFGLGAAFMPGAAGGLPLELDLEATGALSEDWQVRLRTAAFAHLMGPAVDYRRDVFVDGRRVGSQLDVMTGYMQSGFSAFADGVRLLGRDGLYVVGGAGLVAMHETIDYQRQPDYAPSDPQREEDRRQILPAVDLGLGRYGGGGSRSFWRFEIRYQAILHFPSRLTSFPGDNADVTHSLTWQWAWF